MEIKQLITEYEWVKEEIKREIKYFLELNENTTQPLGHIESSSTKELYSSNCLH